MKVIPSPLTTKKWRAVFDDGSHTDFGASGYDDYTLTGDKEQRERYRTRHQKDLKVGNPKSAAYLSYYILWGESKDMKKNIREYKQKFNV